jgi:threonine synthase
VDAPGWDVQFKLEYVSPTGSFKDRGATTTLSRAVELGVDKVVEDSSGNAGAAIATYAARAGIDADVYVPEDVKQSKLMAIQRTGARPVRVEGSREDVTQAAIDAVDDGDAWYASHAWNPAFFAGTMTFAFEVAAQRDWAVPDAVVLPVGHGTLLLGAYRGFKRLYDAGVTEEMPRLLGAQAAGYQPIVDEVRGDDYEPLNARGDEEEDLDEAIQALRDRKSADDEAVTNEVADGIHISEPARMDQLLHAIRDTDGDCVAVTGDAVELTLDRLHRSGFYVEPTCAVAPAALAQYREEGELAGYEDVVVPLTGSGMKTM